MKILGFLLPVFLLLGLTLHPHRGDIHRGRVLWACQTTKRAASGQMNTSQQIGIRFRMAILAVVASATSQASLAVGKTVEQATVISFSDSLRPC